MRFVGESELGKGKDVAKMDIGTEVVTEMPNLPLAESMDWKLVMTEMPPPLSTPTAYMDLATFKEIRSNLSLEFKGSEKEKQRKSLSLSLSLIHKFSFLLSSSSLPSLMEALTSSCSKALASSSSSSQRRRGGASAVRFSEQLDFCFSIRFQNDDKVGNFRFLQMVQNKGISPVHSMPSKTEVDLEMETDHPQQTEGSVDETKVIRIKFQLQKDCKFGEQFLIVGDDPIMGAWDPSNALPMTWSEGHVWFVEMDIPVGKTIQFKFILKGVAGDIIWQPGSDRVIQTWETVNRISICEDWENAEAQKIVEEEQSDLSNGKPQIDSEMSEFSENLEHQEEMISESDEAKDIQTHHEEEQLAEPNLQQITGDSDSTSSSMEKPMPIVAENIGSSEDVANPTVRTKGVNNMALQSETVVHDLGEIGKVEAVNNQEKKVVKNNLFDLEGGPVLVPGLTSPIVPTEVTTKEVEERITMDTSIGELEAKDQNLPELNKEQESDDGTFQEITETLNDEPEMVVNEYEEESHLASAFDEISDSHTVNDNVLQNDVDWGRGVLKKFLTKLGF
ncbi:Phosphoglucan, water dikinase, chloroplastic [Senna tora]|uniref:Phosphoglucan, water dikinase, chloroplastic n=1 Tax=Senna tora TaxID=362788 RepID=A0A835CJE2_9FABA|nr:Phosphoglucan, water dikinase, chloroplastic [Senna tora]